MELSMISNAKLLLVVSKGQFLSFSVNAENGEEAG